MAENVLSSSYTVGAGSSGCRVLVHPKQAVALHRFSRLRFSLFTENSENRFPRRSSRIPQLRGTPAVRHGFFLPIFSFCAQKNRAGTQSAAPHGKFHDEKAYFRKTSCQNRGNVISYRQGAGYPVVGCSYTLLVCCAPTRQTAFFVYVIMLA